MSLPALLQPLVVLDGRDEAPSCQNIANGSVATYSCVNPDKDGPNEDTLAVISCGDDRAVLAVADGFGGLPAGDKASRLAIENMVEAVTRADGGEDEIRNAILNGFEQANRAVIDLGIGAASTLAVVEINGSVVRPYHVGDSEIIVSGQRGKIRFQTVSHSPVAYGVEAGLIDPVEALHHDERNIVSNMVGAADMRIDIGPYITMRPRDTLLVGSDGLFDNLSVAEIVEPIRKGPLEQACATLAVHCRARMTTLEPGVPSKPDDLAIILYRRDA
jgi:serine/threonine protein phosphatase PrpC